MALKVDLHTHSRFGSFESNTTEVRAVRLQRVEEHLTDIGFPNARSASAPDHGSRALQTRRQTTCAG